MRKSDGSKDPSLLNLRKFVVFKFQTITDIDAKGEKGNGDFGNYTGFIVFDKGIVSPDINHSTQHNSLLYENPPLVFQGRVNAS